MSDQMTLLGCLLLFFAGIEMTAASVRAATAAAKPGEEER